MSYVCLCSQFSPEDENHGTNVPGYHTSVAEDVEFAIWVQTLMMSKTDLEGSVGRWPLTSSATAVAAAINKMPLSSFAIRNPGKRGRRSMGEREQPDLYLFQQQV